MTRIYNIASFKLDASPKDYKPINFLNHKHSLRFLLSQSYELNKKNIAKKEIVARELHGTLGVNHSTLNFISNYSFFAENERVILVNTFSCLGDSSLVHTLQLGEYKDYESGLSCSHTQQIDSAWAHTLTTR